VLTPCSSPGELDCLALAPPERGTGPGGGQFTENAMNVVGKVIYRPAGQVGGDFFQVLPTEYGAALVVIGDVSEKGLPAAMTVSLLVGTVRTLAQRGPDFGPIRCRRGSDNACSLLSTLLKTLILRLLVLGFNRTVVGSSLDYSPETGQYPGNLPAGSNSGKPNSVRLQS